MTTSIFLLLHSSRHRYQCHFTDIIGWPQFYSSCCPESSSITIPLYRSLEDDYFVPSAAPEPTSIQVPLDRSTGITSVDGDVVPSSIPQTPSIMVPLYKLPEPALEEDDDHIPSTELVSSTTLTDNLYIYSRRWWEAILRIAGDNLGYRHNFPSNGAITQGRTLLVNWSFMTPSSGHSVPCRLTIKTKNWPCLFHSWPYQHPSCLCDHFQMVVDLLTRLEERGRTLVPYRQEHSGHLAHSYAIPGPRFLYNWIAFAERIGRAWGLQHEAENCFWFAQGTFYFQP